MGAHKVLPLLVAAVLVASTAANRCRQGKDPGTCNSREKRYYFDLDYLQCREFIYNGCGGNQNRFETYDDCSRTCREETNPCKHGMKLPNINCGRSSSRQDCPTTHFCKVHPTDMFAVCCPKPSNTGSSNATSCITVATKCQQDIMQAVTAAGADMKKLCRSVGTFKNCINKLLTACRGTPLGNAGNITSMITTYERMCNQSGCVTGMQRCIGGIMTAQPGQMDYQRLCRNLTGIHRCLSAIRPQCPASVIPSLDQNLQMLNRSCKSLIEKPGECPPVQRGMMGICAETCKADSGCSGNMKCCRTSCGGRSCMNPRNKTKSLIEKPGQCPPVQRGMMGICAETCKADSGCSGNMKCCRTSCGGRSCMIPRNKTRCSNIMCMMYCEYGFQKDSNGCPQCICNPHPCRNHTCHGNHTCKVWPKKCNREPCHYMATCAPPPPSACLVAKQSGPCKAAVTRYYYNSRTKNCERFTWGGCRENSNNFPSSEACEDKCTRACSPIMCRMYCKFGFKKDDRGCPWCSCKPDPCKDHECRRNQKCVLQKVQCVKEPCLPQPVCKETCKEFGCRPCRPDETYRNDSHGCPTCQCVSKCKMRPMCAMFCPDGFERGNDGCPICKCRMPCMNKVCPPGATCVKVRIGCKDKRNADSCLNVTGICRQVKKPGMCPQVGFPRPMDSCARMCKDDSECYGIDKCCASGCGVRCKRPVMDLPRCYKDRLYSIERGHKYVPTCTEHGHFQPRQCDKDGRSCWCAEPRDGLEIDGTRHRKEDNIDCLTHKPHKCSMEGLRYIVTASCPVTFMRDKYGCPTTSCHKMKEEELCQNVTCKPGDKCVAEHVECFRPPCPVIAKCEKAEHPHPRPGPRPRPSPKCPMKKHRGFRIEMFKKRCKQDRDCDKGLKCCNHMCTQPMMHMTKCHMKLARAMVISMATKHRHPVALPRCNKTGSWEPIQCHDAYGICWCVDHYGQPISGTHVRGTPVCRRYQPRTTTKDSFVQVCPQDVPVQKCDPLMCGSKMCPGFPSAVCRINPCGYKCTVEFYDEENKKVNCESDMNKCMKEHKEAKKTKLRHGGMSQYMEKKKQNMMKMKMDIMDMLTGGSKERPESEEGNEKREEEREGSEEMEHKERDDHRKGENDESHEKSKDEKRKDDRDGKNPGSHKKTEGERMSGQRSEGEERKGDRKDEKKSTSERSSHEEDEEDRDDEKEGKRDGKKHRRGPRCPDPKEGNRDECNRTQSCNFDHSCPLKKICCRNACGRLSCMEPRKRFGSEEQPRTMTTPRECLQKKDTGPCRASMPRYFYNSESKKCELFNYGGCQGNDNRFDGKEECEKKCMRKPKKDPCSQEKIVGPCEAAIKSFYFNRKLRKCLEFVYGGCQGNENRFESMEACKKKCMPTEKVGLMVGVFMPKCAPGNTQHHSGFLYKQCHSDHCWCVDREGRPRQGTLTNRKKMLHCTEQGRDARRSDNVAVCPDGKLPTPCHNHCKNAMCFGVKGPVLCKADPCNQCRVSFVDMKHKKVECKREHGQFEKEKVCKLDKDTGVCKARVMRWYHNKNTGRCEQFIWGGCKGNANNFETKEMCMHKCGERVCITGKEPKICETCTKTLKCDAYPEALCITDPCTCKPMFIDINTGKAVDCKKAAGLCRRANAQLKHMYIASSFMGSKPEHGSSEEEKPGMGRPEHGRTDERKPGMGKPEHGRPDEKKPGMGKSEHGRPDEKKPEMGKPEHGGTDERKPGMGTPEHGRPDEKKTEMGKPEHGRPDEKKPGMRKPEHGRPDEKKPGMGQPEHGRPDEKKPGTGKPEHGRPDEKKPGMKKPEHGRPDEKKPGMEQPEHGRPDEKKPGMGKPEHGRPDEKKPGMGKPEPEPKPDGSKQDRSKPQKHHMMKCSESGAFEPKQCMGEKCWCVDDKGRKTKQKGSNCTPTLMERFKGRLTFRHDFKVVKEKIEKFKGVVKGYLAKQLDIDEKYIKILSVLEGSIIVEYEVEKPPGKQTDIAAAMEKHSDQIARGEIVVVFEKIEMKVDPTSSSLTEQYKQDKPSPKPSSEPTPEPKPKPEPMPMNSMIIILCVVIGGIVIVLIMGIALLVTHRRAVGKRDISLVQENKKMAMTNEYKTPEMVKVT